MKTKEEVSNLEVQLSRIADALEELTRSLDPAAAFNGNTLSDSMAMIAEAMYDKQFPRKQKEKAE